MNRILFYDGDCGICIRSVRFLLKWDRNQRIHFAPLQGTTAQSLLTEGLRKELSTAVYRRREGEIYLRSDAVLQALIDTESIWRFTAQVLLWLPKGFRDTNYNYLAENRVALSRETTCSIPAPESQTQMLP